jgi:hypothetical protein
LNEGPDAVVDRWIALERVPVDVGRRSEPDPEVEGFIDGNEEPDVSNALRTELVVKPS